MVNNQQLIREVSPSQWEERSSTMIGTDGHNKKNISAFLRSNALTITIQLVGLVVVVANLWIATKLAPVAQDLAVLIQRVSAIEETINYHTKELDELKNKRNK